MHDIVLYCDGGEELKKNCQEQSAALAAAAPFLQSPNRELKSIQNLFLYFSTFSQKLNNTSFADPSDQSCQAENHQHVDGEVAAAASSRTLIKPGIGFSCVHLSILRLDLYTVPTQTIAHLEQQPTSNNSLFWRQKNV